MKKSLLGRLARFTARPWPEKARRAMSRCLRAFPQISLPVRLPFGAWWLARNDSCGQAILAGAFENHEHLAAAGDDVPVQLDQLDLQAAQFPRIFLLAKLRDGLDWATHS